MTHFVHRFYPRVFGLHQRLDGGNALRVQMRDALGDPLHVLFDGGQHITQHAGTARAGDHEKIGKPGTRHTEVSTGPLLPFIGEPLPIPTLNIHLE